MNLPIGLTMKAYNVNDNGNAYPDNDISAWNETVTISINQEPNYLYMDSGDPDLIKLGLRNINVFGPSGLPLLPPFSWFATLNIWTIEVQGEINKFVVQDINNEVHPDPIFGHGAQVHVRENADVLDDAVTTLRIGNNEAIKFSFITGTFIVVPPGKTIGDTTGESKGKSCPPPICEESSKFDEILK